jgi:hypothetical protein
MLNGIGVKNFLQESITGYLTYDAYIYYNNIQPQNETCSCSAVFIQIAYRGGVAHLGERLTGSQEVKGSIPFISTKKNR